MTSLIFVHGTGGRRSDYAATFHQIEEELRKRRPDVKLYPCLWGEKYGAKLNAGGASIPAYEKLEGGRTLSVEEVEIQLWKKLYEEPFSQMRELGMRIRPRQSPTPGGRQQSPQQELKGRVEALKTDVELRSKLSKVVDDDVWEQVFNEVISHPSFRQLLKTAARPLADDYKVIAQTVVAAYIEKVQEVDVHPVLLRGTLRNEAVDTIFVTLTRNETDRGVVSWTKKQLAKVAVDVAKQYGKAHMKRKRGATMDATYPFAGDILVYQSKGQKIRSFIHQQIDQAQSDLPVVLMAHSLGGVACVDLLIEQDLSQKVDCLITVGSQAPFFYEIGALQQLEYNNPLPPYFPKTWLNIYDDKDYLSFIGNCDNIFPGRIKDVMVDNGEPFPESHGAYWSGKDKKIWDAIESVLP